MTPKQPRHLHIDRLDLDLRGIDPLTAQAAVRALGPALARTLGAGPGPRAPGMNVDAGQLATAAAPAPHDLAAAMAQRIATSLKVNKP
ncbi:hypothetical protein F2P44_16145 [Massilia sp. CCM 8695]|uniref:Uncharacterized protein n=1 Tax=Massilia frigida TaxID=2609281 RepID=A0ABX0N5Z3_9BURK|nr:hypothetical protein [Massilia frigida]NHZ80792.1 hypothetical protein [Massilia frigida]